MLYGRGCALPPDSTPFFPASLLLLLCNECVCVTKPYIGKHEPTDHVAQSARTCTNTNAATRGPRGLLSPLGLCASECKCCRGSAHAYDAHECARVDLLQIS